MQLKHMLSFVWLDLQLEEINTQCLDAAKVRAVTN